MAGVYAQLSSTRCSGVQGVYEAPCAARECEDVGPRITATECRSPLGLPCGASLRTVSVSCFSYTLGSAISDIRDWPHACLYPSAANSSATSATSGGTSVTISTAVENGTTVETQVPAVSLPAVGSGVAETIEECPVMGSGGSPRGTTSASKFADFLDPPQGLPGCNSANASYVYSAWQACADDATGQPISCSDSTQVPWGDGDSLDAPVRFHSVSVASNTRSVCYSIFKCGRAAVSRSVWSGGCLCPVHS